MAGYLVLDRKTKKYVLIGAGVSLALFILGVVIGYVSAPKGSTTTADCNLSQAMSASCPTTGFNDTGKRYVDKYLKQFSSGSCIRSKDQCYTLNQPRNYVAQHLQGKTITIDGRLDEDAWQEVPWTSSFVDIRSDIFPKPRFETKVKLRWDDTKLYIGAYLQETDLWGTLTMDDSPVWQDNSLEILIDVDGSMHNYKQVEINVLNTTYDLMYYQSPYDYGNWSGRSDNWTAGIEKAVYANGTVNRPGDVDNFWSLEISLTFSALAQNSSRSTPQVADGETWFMTFGRSAWKLNVTSDNRYVKVGGPGIFDDVKWSSWQPCGAVNLHLQDRWGLVQFRKDTKNKNFDYKKWHIYKALFTMMDALEKFNALNGKFVDKVEELDVPPYVLSGLCFEVPTIKLVQRKNMRDFEVTVKSKLISGPPGHIRSDRYVWFQ